MKPDEVPRLYRFGPCTYAPNLRELRHAQVRVLVPLQESKVLMALLQRPGEVVTKPQLCEILWPNERYGAFDRAIHNLISKLRRLHPDAARWIETVPKAGYVFSLAVETEWAPPPSSEPSEQLTPPPSPEPSEQVTPPPSPAHVEELTPPPSPEPSEQLTPRSTAAPERGSEPVPPVSASESIPASALVAVAALPALPARSRSAPKAIGAIALAAAVSGAVAWLVLDHYRAAATLPPTAITMVGVLPFSGAGGELGESDTLREQVADAVASIPGAEVRAAHSLTPSMSESPEQLQRAAQQLRLDLLIAGKLDVRDPDYALNLEIIRGVDATHLSSLHYRGNRAGLGALPEKIANDIAPFLRRHVPGAEPQRMLGSTPSQSAYDLAFRARAALAQRSKPEVTQAIALYNEAIEVDPNFARAWSGLAESELVMANFGDSSAIGQQFERARHAASQALALDPSNSQAHSTLGLILLQHDCKLAQAEWQLRSAIDSNPGFAANHLRMAVLLTDEGRFAEAGTEIERAHDTDPDWPVIYGTAMYVHIMARDYERAIADAETLVRFRPDWSRAHQHLGWALWYAGRHDPAVKEWRRAAVLDQDASAVALQDKGMQLLDQQGVRAYAEFRVAAHQSQPDGDDFVLAEWYAFAGDPGHTLDELEHIVAARSPESLKIPWNPAYDFLRTQPRFQHLVDELHARCAR